MKEDLRKEIELPNNTSVKIDGTIKITGPQGDVEKKLIYPKIKISNEGNKLILESKKATKKEKKIINAFSAHLKNMIKGVVEKHTYKLKICSGHFPMNVSISNNQLIVKNFLGESIPRKITIKPGVEVKTEGAEIIVTGISKEITSQMAASIEQLCRIRNKDLRIFQDGIWITNKGGKEV